MIAALVVALTLGVVFGTFTGLFPGVHINLVAAMLLAAIGSGHFSLIAPLTFAVFIVAMSITHTFLDFIPSVFLGAPDDSTVLAVLPGHQLLLKGRGQEAVVLTLFGSMAGLVILLGWTGLFILFLPTVFEFLQRVIGYLLLFVSLFLVFREREWILAGVVFCMAGFLGLFTFELPVREPLLPLLSGLFGVSGLLVSLREQPRVPVQTIVPVRHVHFGWRDFLRGSARAAVSAPLCSFLPGIGSGHAAVLATELEGRERDDRTFLFVLGAINTIVMGLSFVTLYSIGKGRTGSAASVGTLLNGFGLGTLGILLGAIVVSGVLAFFVALFMTRVFARFVGRVSYTKISFGVLGLLFLLTLFLSNWLGLLVLVTGAAIGVFGITSGVRRIQLMGCLLVPTIVYYLIG